MNVSQISQGIPPGARAALQNPQLLAMANQRAASASGSTGDNNVTNQNLNMLKQQNIAAGHLQSEGIQSAQPQLQLSQQPQGSMSNGTHTFIAQLDALSIQDLMNQKVTLEARMQAMKQKITHLLAAAHSQPGGPREGFPQLDQMRKEATLANSFHQHIMMALERKKQAQAQGLSTGRLDPGLVALVFGTSRSHSKRFVRSNFPDKSTMAGQSHLPGWSTGQHPSIQAQQQQLALQAQQQSQDAALIQRMPSANQQQQQQQTTLPGQQKLSAPSPTPQPHRSPQYGAQQLPRGAPSLATERTVSQEQQSLLSRGVTFQQFFYHEYKEWANKRGLGAPNPIDGVQIELHKLFVKVMGLGGSERVSGYVRLKYAPP